MQRFFNFIFLSLISLPLQAALECSKILKTSSAPVNLKSVSILQVPAADRGVGFIVPNETQPLRLKPTLSHLPVQGLLLSVGTERGFISAAMAQGHIQGLVFLDLNPNVVLFNLMNKALLALANDRNDYLHLRLQADFKQLQNQLAKKNRLLSKENLNLLKRPELWAWWQQHVQNSSAWLSFHRPAEQNTDASFKEVNYLFDDHLFATLSSLAKTDRIFVYQGDLLSHESLMQISRVSEYLDLPYALIDLSNSWQEGYMGHESTNALLKKLMPFAQPNSLINFSYMNGQYRNSKGEVIFFYSSLSFKDLKSSSTAIPLMQNLAQLEKSKPQTQTGFRNPRFRDDMY